MGEAGCTKYGPVLRRLERHSCVAPTLGADDLCFDTTPPLVALSLRLARLAAFRFVSESLAAEEFLFPGRKHKRHSAFGTLQLTVSQVHGRSSRVGKRLT